MTHFIWQFYVFFQLSTLKNHVCHIPAKCIRLYYTKYKSFNVTFLQAEDNSDRIVQMEQGAFVS